MEVSVGDEVECRSVGSTGCLDCEVQDVVDTRFASYCDLSEGGSNGDVCAIESVSYGNDEPEAHGSDVRRSVDADVGGHFERDAQASETCEAGYIDVANEECAADGNCEPGNSSRGAYRYGSEVRCVAAYDTSTVMRNSDCEMRDALQLAGGADSQRLRMVKASRQMDDYARIVASHVNPTVPRESSIAIERNENRPVSLIRGRYAAHIDVIDGESQSCDVMIQSQTSAGVTTRGLTVDANPASDSEAAMDAVADVPPAPPWVPPNPVAGVSTEI
jgi:hypothetical protein